jgi:tRNA(Ile2) C34 agmatinyltransferase TiaS
MNAPPICEKCHLTMERVANTTDLFRCPLCYQCKQEAPKLSVNVIPKCPVCGRRTVPQGEWFVCPVCRGIVDDQPDGITDASYDPTRRLEREESRKQRHPAHHRGGTFKRWSPRQAGLR